MIQNSLTSALLLTWTKKFKCSGTEMEDVVKMLEEAIDRKEVRLLLPVTVMRYLWST